MGDGRQEAGYKLAHTLRVRKHAHQGRQLGGTTPVSNVKPAASRAMHTPSVGGRLLLLLLLWLLLLLVLLHGEQKGGVGSCTSCAVTIDWVWRGGKFEQRAIGVDAKIRTGEYALVVDELR